MDVESIAGVDTPPLLYVGLVCISVVPVALVFGIRGVLEHQHFESINERIFVSIVSFVFLSILVLPYSSVILHEFREREGAAKEAIVGAGLFGILAFGASGA